MKSIAQEVLESLLVYKKENNYLPELIVIYRDGVGDS